MRCVCVFVYLLELPGRRLVSAGKVSYDSVMREIDRVRYIECKAEGPSETRVELPYGSLQCPIEMLRSITVSGVSRSRTVGGWCHNEATFVDARV